jgi:uncharacterized membrane protein YraQ (UPF0718 family)
MTAVSSMRVCKRPWQLTPWGMFVNADKVVKAVLIGLTFASVITWTLSPHAISGCAARSNNVFSTSAAVTAVLLARRLGAFIRFYMLRTPRNQKV